MKFLWNEQSIQWFLDASSYADFHSTLMRHIAPYLEPDYTVCDIGCGLGRLTLQIASHVSSITAVDIEANVIAQLERDVAISGFQNVSVRCADATALTGSFDIVLMSFFGKSGSDMEDYYPLCNRRLIRIVNEKNGSPLYPGQHRHTIKDTVQTVKQELDGQNRGYELILDTIEFGQPLRSWQAAKQYVLNNAPEASSDEISIFLQEHIIQTGRDDFPLYLPNPKTIGIFIITMEGF